MFHSALLAFLIAIPPIIGAPQPARACCIPIQGCEFLTKQCCLARGGTWQAEGTTCPGGTNPVDCTDPNPESGGGDPGKGDDESPIPIPVDPPQTIVERGGDIDLPGEVYLDREYVYGPDYVDEFIAQFDRDGHAIFMLQDGNYNVVVLVSGPGHPGGDDGQGNPQPLPTGTVLEQYTYEPYGALVAAEMYYAHAMNRAGHQGLFFERFDGSYDDYTLFRVAQGTAFITGAKGLYYNRNRYYSPTLGRFTTRDPNETALPIITAMAMNAQSLSIISGGFDGLTLYGNGMNLFQYVGDNPVNRLDPTGMWSLLEMTVTAGKYAGTAAVVAGQASRVLGAAYAVVGALQYLDGVTLLASMSMLNSWSNQWTQYAHNAIAQGNKDMITGALLMSGGWAMKVAGRALTQAAALLSLGSGAAISRPLTASDLGIQGVVTELQGTVSIANSVATVRIDMIKAKVQNPLAIVNNLINLAKANNATILRIEGTLANPTLLEFIRRHYGAITVGANEIIEILVGG